LSARQAAARLVAGAAAVLAALVALLGAQAAIARAREYLPDDPGYTVDAVVRPAGTAHGAAPLRLALLGDSTVAGLGAPTAEESLALLVAERVATTLDRPVHVVGHGVSGAVTRDVVEGQVPLLAGFDPDVVVAVVGANDVTHGTPPWRLRARVADLGDAVDATTGAPLVLGGIPLFGGATAIDRPLRDVVEGYAGILRRAQEDAAAEAGIRYVPIAREASPRFVGVPDAMSRDRFHPGPVGYGFWADAIAPAVLDVLR
jgi:lysophospholipase L1-like esterase